MLKGKVMLKGKFILITFCISEYVVLIISNIANIFTNLNP